MPANDVGTRVKVAGKNYEIGHGDVVIAAITSCTNTSNPSVLVAAGLVARKARALGLTPKPWVKTSLAPGSQVVTEYLDKAGLTADLDALGFNLVGYGCTTCIGNSGPLDDAIADAIEDNKLVARLGAVGQPQLRGPRASERARQLPGLAAAGGGLRAARHDDRRHHHRTARHRRDGKPVYLKDIWPTNKEIARGGRRRASRAISSCKRYGEVFKGPKQWQAIEVDGDSETYDWSDSSTYVQNPPYFEGMTMEPAPRERHHRRAHPGAARRLHHHRPHQPGRQHPQGLAGRRISAASDRSCSRTSTATARGAATTKS